VKTTLEIPDAIFRRAKAAAAEQGIPLRQLVSEAIAEKLTRKSRPARPWMEVFGALSDLHEETKRIDRIIHEEFEKIDDEDWR
jgi:hypothetical protein